MKTITNFSIRLNSFLRKKLRHFTINYDETKVPSYTLPDPLRFVDGGYVTSPKGWQKNRRFEIIRLFKDHVYGHCHQLPKIAQFIQTSNDFRALEGLATRKEVTILLNKQSGSQSLRLLLYIPNHSPKPVPAILGLNFFGNHTIHPDPGICLTQQWQKHNRNGLLVQILPSEQTRGSKANRWPVEKILKSGYALATVYYGDLEPDFHEGWRYGIRAFFCGQQRHKINLFSTKEISAAFGQPEDSVGESSLPAHDDWGAIGVWAWGLSRIMDFLECESDILASQVVLFGHSRLGKAALWAGAQDDRFAIVISNNSGCGGAALSRRRFGETIKLLNVVRPHWFSKNFKNFNGKEYQLPVDQHMLIALIAPRPVYVASAEKDLSADPLGEFLSAKKADSVYNLLGLTGLGVEQMPILNEPVGKTIGYHIRKGEHNITDYDWEQFLRFANKHFGKNFENI
ncbi:MAG: acetylxylan esterase [Deltaproteobacteria bacterium]|nr:acetylxylan esterase [Deltaproteobacteria bacterium]